MMMKSDKTQVSPNQPVLYKKTLIALILIAVMSSAYTVYSSIHVMQTTRMFMTETQTLKQQQLQTQRNLDAASNELQKTRQSLADLRQEAAHFLQNNNPQHNAWMLFKARFYVESAMINNHWGQNTETSIALLQEADAILSRLHDPHVIAVRQAIAQDMADMQAIQSIDLTGILMRFDAIQQMLNQLPPKKPQALTKPVHPDTHTAVTWREHLAESLHALRQLIVIRHHDHSIEAFLVPGYESLLRENIRLNLQEAQWAVIQQNQAVYQIGVNQAIRTISEAFDADNPATKAIINQLVALRETSFETKKPSVSRSLQQLNQWIEESSASRGHGNALESGDNV